MVGLRIETRRGINVYDNFAKNIKVQFNDEIPQRLSILLKKSVQDTIQKDWTGQAPSSGYGLSTGKLAKSWRSETRRSPGRITIKASSTLPYAGIHATGGTITGKPFLAIPLARAEQYWGTIDLKKALVVYGPPHGPAVLIRKAKINPKPIGSSLNYLELSARRFLDEHSARFSESFAKAWNKSGRGRG